MLFFDKNQSIYQQDNLEWANNAECKLTLNTNCRNTKEIARTSARNIGLDNKTFINSPVKGEQSFVADYKTAVEGIKIVERIVSHLVRDKSARPEDIVVLTVKKDEPSILDGLTSISNFPASFFLERGRICVNNVNDFKGLEAGYLILTDIEVSHYTDPYYRGKMYIGCSRAKQGLYMLLDNPTSTDYESAMQAIESKKKIKKNRINFFQKLAVSELDI